MSIFKKIHQGKFLTKSDLRQPCIANDELLAELQAPSFTDLLKVKHYMGDGIYVFREHNQLGAVLRVTPICINNKNSQEQLEILNDIQFALTNSVPNEYSDHWISQIYVVKNNSPKRAINDLRNYIDKDFRLSNFTQAYLREIEEHLMLLANKGFHDINANDNLWILSQYDIYICLYQEKYIKPDPQSINKQYVAIQEVVVRVKNAFKQVGILMSEVASNEYVNFLSIFFHNHEIQIPKTASIDILDLDLSEFALDKVKISYSKNMWHFQHNNKTKRSAYCRIDGINDKLIKIGHLNSEQKDRLSLLDKLPKGSIYTQSIIHIHSDGIKDILNAIINRSKGTDSEVVNNRDSAEHALQRVADGDLIYRLTAGVFIASDKKEDLDKKIRTAKSVFDARGLNLIKPSDNPLCQDDFIIALPFNYNYMQDQKFYKKDAFLVQSLNLAQLMPVYGRETGSGNPLFTFFNRGGEPLFFDPLKDYSQNAFALIFGSSGSGKSATLVYLLMQLITVYNPRIFIIEKGESFSLLVKYCESLGLTTHRVVINSVKESMPLSPFADATKILDQEKQDSVDWVDADNKDDIDENRDILGELIIIAKLMITGGEQKEMDRFRRHHNFDVGNAIRLAAQNCKKESKTVLTQDVIAALKEVAKNKESDDEKNIINAFADSMNVFINSNFDKKLFNTAGESFPEVDITQFDVGKLGDTGNEDKLVVAFISLMMRINNIAERDQYDKRPIIVLGDEAHLYATNALLAPYIIKIAKMWRKLGAWLWLATQSLDDFKGPSERMINTMEWLILLSLKPKEIDVLKQFVDLTPEQENLLKSNVEQKRRYKEGVVFNQSNEDTRFLFRSMPPALALALGMTAPEEKTQRQQIMKKHNCTELEAVFKVAEMIKDNLR